MSDVLNLPNSIWPNGIKVDDEGYAVFYPLGTNKIEVPTDTTQWPSGDKLVSPFVYQNDKIVGFCDTMAMTVSGNMTTTMPYEHIEADFSSIEEGKLTVNAPNAVVKKFSWSVVDSGDGDGDDNIIISFKYKGCKTVDDIKAVDANYQTTDVVGGVWTEWLGDLTNGSKMFQICIKLKSFSSDLSSLTNGGIMFGNCTGLTSFDGDLSSLTSGGGMFQSCINLATFNCNNLSNLTSGDSMFKSCYELTTFTYDLPKLTDGDYMFEFSGLTTFTSNLPKLKNADDMFNDCMLDAPSVKNIIDTINTVNPIVTRDLTLGMGCKNTNPDKNLFAQEAGYTNMTSLLAALQAKGWTVTAQYNGRPTTTYGLRRPSEDTLPVFVKLEEMEDHANYTSIDGSKKYRFKYFHETTGSTDGYTQFNSLEEAIEHFNIKPIERTR